MVDQKKGCDYYCCHGESVNLPSVRTDWVLALVVLWALLTFIVTSGKWMRPCVAWMITLLCLMKFSPINGLVKYLRRTKCSVKIWSPISKSFVAVVNGCSNWPAATCIRKIGGSSIFKLVLEGCYSISSSSVSTVALAYAPESTRASIVRPFLSFATFRNSHKKWIYFWFAGFKTSL